VSEQEKARLLERIQEEARGAALDFILPVHMDLHTPKVAGYRAPPASHPRYAPGHRPRRIAPSSRCHAMMSLGASCAGNRTQAAWLCCGSVPGCFRW
jgi:hypothetical protein